MRWLFTAFIVLVSCLTAAARPVSAPQYGIDTLVANDTLLNEAALKYTDSVLAAHPMLASTYIYNDIQSPHVMPQQTTAFYLLLFLCFLLGLIRHMDRRYFINLWRAFWNPTLSNRQLKEQLQSAGLSNFLMNVFFAIAGGAYMYYVVKYYTPTPSGVLPTWLLVTLLIAGTGIIYISKYAAVRFSGWAFRVEGITEHYLFNVFLINKVLGVALIPFIIILAFGAREWLGPIVIISFITSGVLLINRYFRSWQVFGSFFHYSKFHFFMYLCASELLPLAVLMKLLSKGLLFY